MNIILKIIDKCSHKDMELTIDEPVTLLELMGQLRLERTSVGMILINGKPKKFDYVLNENCEVYILPLLMGG